MVHGWCSTRHKPDWGMASDNNLWTHMLMQQDVMTSHAMSIWSEPKQGGCPLVGWLSNTLDVICLPERNTSVHRRGWSVLQRKTCSHCNTFNGMSEWQGESSWEIMFSATKESHHNFTHQRVMSCMFSAMKEWVSHHSFTHETVMLCFRPLKSDITFWPMKESHHVFARWNVTSYFDPRKSDITFSPTKEWCHAFTHQNVTSRFRSSTSSYRPISCPKHHHGSQSASAELGPILSASHSRIFVTISNCFGIKQTPHSRVLFRVFDRLWNSVYWYDVESRSPLV